MNSFSPYGVDLFGQPITAESASPVAQKFIVPPFSVLNTRDVDWQNRKRAWASIGIRGEIGRDAEAYGCGSSGDMSKSMRTEVRDRSSMDPMPESSKEDYQRIVLDSNFGSGVKGGVSIFDPVLCELIYRWFSAPGQQIVDPFAGGSVRGIVASCLGRKYWGCDLRQEQIDANREQGAELCKGDNMPEWVCGCSREKLVAAPMADLVFSCPPYGDLEEYSQDPLDLSCMAHGAFVESYRAIIAQAVARLRPDRFACFVVGDFRDSKGFYRNFVSETIRAFEDAGAMLYNEAILVTSVGSACMRVTRQFEAGRKFAKTHQNILVFCKGNWRKATRELTI